MEQFLSVANLVRSDIEQTMKMEVAAWIKDYVTDMEDLFTDLKLKKLKLNTTTLNQGSVFTDYTEMFQEIKQEKKRKAEEKNKTKRRAIGSRTKQRKT